VSPRAQDDGGEDTHHVRKFTGEIEAFEAQDRARRPAEGGLLFLGSSSIRRWNLERSFPGTGALNRGFGGSTIDDAVYFFDRVVAPYAPSAIVFYAGDNDISQGKAPEAVFADFVTFMGRVRKLSKETLVVFVTVKPSPDRWDLWPGMRRVNDMVYGYSAADPMLDVADIATPMLAARAGEEDGPPPDTLFADDGLHLSGEGYALWTRVVKERLAARSADRRRGSR
jgi:lysophospholipase L1-like esterase